MNEKQLEQIIEAWAWASLRSDSDPANAGEVIGYMNCAQIMLDAEGYNEAVKRVAARAEEIQAELNAELQAEQQADVQEEPAPATDEQIEQAAVLSLQQRLDADETITLSAAQIEDFINVWAGATYRMETEEEGTPDSYRAIGAMKNAHRLSMSISGEGDEYDLFDRMLARLDEIRSERK